MDKQAYLDGCRGKVSEDSQYGGLARGDIISILKEHGHPDMGITAGSALVLRGLRDETSDIDAIASPDLFKHYRDLYNIQGVDTAKGGGRKINIPGTPIDLHEEAPGRDYSKLEDVDVNVETIKSLLEFYQSMNRDKDHKWIEVLKQRMEG